MLRNTLLCATISMYLISNVSTCWARCSNLSDAYNCPSCTLNGPGGDEVYTICNSAGCTRMTPVVGDDEKWIISPGPGWAALAMTTHNCRALHFSNDTWWNR